MDSLRVTWAIIRQYPWIALGTLAGLAGYVTLYTLLSLNAQWPANCVPSGRRWSLVLSSLYCSPGLLSGGAVEWAFFALLWSWPVGLGGFFAWIWWKTQRS